MKQWKPEKKRSEQTSSCTGDPNASTQDYKEVAVTEMIQHVAPVLC